MFDNIGGKIKGLAKFIFVLEAIAGIMAGLVIIGLDTDMVLLGLGFMIGVPVLAWVSSFLLYGFGEIIVKLTQIEENTRSERKFVPHKTDDSERIKRLESLLARGIITEEEYRQALAKEQ